MTRGATRKNGITNHARGWLAEQIATLYLFGKGYRIRARRYKTPVGEIDLIATRGRTLVFFEVKIRDTVHNAQTAIHPSSLSRLRHTAELYRARHPQFAAYHVRFDLVALAPPYHVVHLDNVDLSGA